MRGPDRIGAKGAEKDLSLQLGVALLQGTSDLVKAPEEGKKGEHTSRVLKANRFSIDLRTYTRPSTLQLTTSIWDTVHGDSNIIDARRG
jgi:hypothetical protein